MVPIPAASTETETRGPPGRAARLSLPLSSARQTPLWSLNCSRRTEQQHPEMSRCPKWPRTNWYCQFTFQRAMKPFIFQGRAKIASGFLGEGGQEGRSQPSLGPAAPS